MRLLILCLMVACSGGGDKEDKGKSYGEAPKMADVPAHTTSDAPEAPALKIPHDDDPNIAVGEMEIPQSGRVLPANVTKYEPTIPEGATLGPVERDYEYLSKTRAIETCPTGAKRLEKVSGYERWDYCGLENGVRHGPWISFVKGGTYDGALKEIGPFVGGKREGIFTSWSETGKMTSRYEWIHGEPGAGQVFD